GGGRVGQVGDPVEQFVPLPGGGGLVGLGLGQLLLELPELLDLLRAGRAAPGGLLLRGPETLGPLGVLAPAGVGRQQRVKVVGSAAAAQCFPVTVRVLPRGFEVNHLRESSGAGRPPRTGFPAPGRYIVEPAPSPTPPARGRRPRGRMMGAGCRSGREDLDRAGCFLGYAAG